MLCKKYFICLIFSPWIFWCVKDQGVCRWRAGHSGHCSMSRSLTAVWHSQTQGGLASGWPGLGILSACLVSSPCDSSLLVFNSVENSICTRFIWRNVYYYYLFDFGNDRGFGGVFWLRGHSVWPGHGLVHVLGARFCSKGLHRSVGSLKPEPGWTGRHLSRPGRISRFWPCKWFRP